MARAMAASLLQPHSQAFKTAAAGDVVHQHASLGIMVELIAHLNLPQATRGPGEAMGCQQQQCIASAEPRSLAMFSSGIHPGWLGAGHILLLDLLAMQLTS
jgi:hypothetical protein